MHSRISELKRIEQENEAEIKGLEEVIDKLRRKVSESKSSVQIPSMNRLLQHLYSTKQQLNQLKTELN